MECSEPFTVQILLRKKKQLELGQIDTPRREFITNINNSKSGMNPLNEALSEPDENLDISAFQTEKYFDNLVALIEEALKGCIFEKEICQGIQL